MNWIAVLSLCAYATSTVIRIGIQTKSDDTQQLLKQWEDFLQSNHETVGRPVESRTQRLHNDLSWYSGNFTIGTPPQQFVFAINTRGTGLWVYDSTFTESGFNSSLSETYAKDGRVYSDEGFLGKDTVKFGGVDEQQVSVENVIFAQLNHPRIFYGGLAEGEFGLGFRSKDGRSSPIVDAFDQGLLDRPTFTIWLEAAGHVGGQITYGGLDTEHCGDIIAYEPLQPKAMDWDSDWTVKVDSFGVGDKYSSNVGWMATFQTSIFSVGPGAVIDGLAGALGLGRNNSISEFYISDCDAKLPPISMTIGGIAYEIESSNYLLPKFISSAEVPDVCEFAFDGDGDHTGWTFGVAFMRQLCTVYDFKEGKIGFAPQKQNPTTRETSAPTLASTNGHDTTTNSNPNHDTKTTSFVCATVLTLLASLLFD